LRGHGRPASGVVWPDHWANDASTPYLSYKPRVIADSLRPLQLTLLLTDPSHERLALLVQQQLQKVGVEVALEFLPLDQALARVQAGNFDAWFADVIQGPTLVRSYLFWHSASPYNWGHFRSAPVDAALDSIRHAASDAEYKDGVASFQRAIVNDPPAIFLAWSERARAVSTRFEVPVEPGRDILSTLRLWRPVAGSRNLIRN
jgi:ABC-type transport system substrate-binding protein